MIFQPSKTNKRRTTTTLDSVSVKLRGNCEIENGGFLSISRVSIRQPEKIFGAFASLTNVSVPLEKISKPTHSGDIAEYHLLYNGND